MLKTQSYTQGQFNEKTAEHTYNRDIQAPSLVNHYRAQKIKHVEKPRQCSAFTDSEW
jgi:hypothetical protein